MAGKVQPVTFRWGKKGMLAYMGPEPARVPAPFLPHRWWGHGDARTVIEEIAEHLMGATYPGPADPEDPDPFWEAFVSSGYSTNGMRAWAASQAGSWVATIQSGRAHLNSAYEGWLIRDIEYHNHYYAPRPSSGIPWNLHAEGSLRFHQALRAAARVITIDAIVEGYKEDYAPGTPVANAAGPETATASGVVIGYMAGAAQDPDRVLVVPTSGTFTPEDVLHVPGAAAATISSIDNDPPEPDSTIPDPDPQVTEAIADAYDAARRAVDEEFLDAITEAMPLAKIADYGPFPSYWWYSSVEATLAAVVNRLAWLLERPEYQGVVISTYYGYKRVPGPADHPSAPYWTLTHERMKARYGAILGCGRAIADAFGIDLIAYQRADSEYLPTEPVDPVTPVLFGEMYAEHKPDHVVFWGNNRFGSGEHVPWQNAQLARWQSEVSAWVAGAERPREGGRQSRSAPRLGFPIGRRSVRRARGRR